MNLKFLMLVTTLIFLTHPYTAMATNCGKVKGNKIVTYGGLSCVTAKHVYTAFLKGQIMKGWTCGLSAGACDRDDGKEGFSFRFN